jgi:hypothetical protein
VIGMMAQASFSNPRRSMVSSVRFIGAKAVLAAH